MATYTFTATPLTPIHVGTGETLDTSRYLVDGDRLVEISLARLTAHLSAEELADLTRLAEGSDLQRLLDFLRHRADAKRDGIASMRVSRRFADHFQQKQHDPRSRLLVNPMTRNYQAGHPYLPGSAIKGALRTALVSCLADCDTRLTNVRPRDGRNLEERVLDFDFRRGLHEDPFRTVKVADADLAAEATLVSRFLNLHRNPDKPGSKGIQAWYERLLSRADGLTPPTFTVEIQIDEPRQHYNGRDLVGTRITLDDLREAANRFYAGRFVAEWNRFHHLRHMKSAGALARGFSANGTLTLPQSPAILLRVGRFSHFESLSVDHLRKGYNIQAKRPITEGNTRNLCLLDNGEQAPFGWLLLTPRAGDPAEQRRDPPQFAPHKVSIPTATIAAQGAGSGGGASVVPMQRPVSALDPKELSRRQGMKIGEWLTTVKKVKPITYRAGDPRLKKLREEFKAWQQGQ